MRLDAPGARWRDEIYPHPARIEYALVQGLVAAAAVDGQGLRGVPHGAGAVVADLQVGEPGIGAADTIGLDVDAVVVGDIDHHRRGGVYHGVLVDKGVRRGGLQVEESLSVGALRGHEREQHDEKKTEGIPVFHSVSDCCEYDSATKKGPDSGRR